MSRFINGRTYRDVPATKPALPEPVKIETPEQFEQITNDKPKPLAVIIPKPTKKNKPFWDKE
jgi:hypothetical protein